MTTNHGTPKNGNGDLVTVSATLSRWHKYVQRIGDLLNVVEADAAKLASKTSVSDFLGATQVKALQFDRERLRDLFSHHRRPLGTRAAIRGALGRKNHELGIDDLLAHIDAQKRRLQWLIAIEKTQHPDRVPPEELEVLFGRLSNAAKPLASRREEYGNRQGVDVRMIPPAELEAIRAEIEDLRRSLLTSADRLSEFNAQRMELAIGREVAQLIGAAP